MCRKYDLDSLNTQVEIHSDVSNSEYNLDSNLRHEGTVSTAKLDDVLYRCLSVRIYLLRPVPVTIHSLTGH
jgi:hypothetical protein